METKTAGYLTQTKVSKSRNGQSKSYTYSTVIPKVIVNKFELEKGKKLYWDISDKDTIIIKPELPEEASIEAGTDILNDMLINGNTTSYLRAFSKIKTQLEAPAMETQTKITNIVNIYTSSRAETEKADFKQVVVYLLDYPLNLPDQYEILREVYNQITQTD